MEYFIKSSAVITLFYIFYKLLLQRDTFFEFNRAFFLIGILTSFLIPFVVIPIYIEYTPVNRVININQLTSESFIATKAIEESFQLLDLILLIYLLGIVGFSIRFILQFTSLYRVIKKNKHEKKADYTLISTSENMMPFSFFKWIVINPSLFNKKELDQIMSHEKVHVKQYHSIDNITSQLACIVLWFHPFIWMYQKDVKQNLEFIADKNAQKNTQNKKSYQYTLLKTSIPNYQLVITNNFYNSLIKKRIIMLQKTASKKINLLKYALVIPMLALFLMNFHTEKVYVKKEITKRIVRKSKDIKIIFHKDLTNNDLKKIQKELKKQSIKFTYSNLKRNEKREIINILTTFEDGTGFTTWNAYNAENEPIKTFYFFKKEKESGVRIVNKKNEATINNIASESKYNLSISIDSIFSDLGLKPIEKATNNFGKEPMYMLNGKEISKKELRKINTSNIKSVSILKGESAKAIYGNKAKNGVVLIKGEKKSNKKDIIEIILNKNTTIEKLKKQSKYLKENHNIDFNFEIVNKNQKLADFKYSFYNGEQKQEASISDIIPFSKLENSLIINYNLETKLISIDAIVDGIKHDSTSSRYLDDNYVKFYINDTDTDKILKKYKTLMKEKGVIIKFLDIKRDVKNRIKEIKIETQIKGSKTSNKYKLDGKNLNGISIGFYSNGNGLEIEPVLNTF